MPQGPLVTQTNVKRFGSGGEETTPDLVACEAPLQVLVDHGPEYLRSESSLGITMRTPGDDLDLVRGFLLSEGVINRVRDLIGLRHCAKSTHPENTVRAVLRPNVTIPDRLSDRAEIRSAACGVCGERTLDDLQQAGVAPVRWRAGSLQASVLKRAYAALQHSQLCFRHTGGTHAAACFDWRGELLCVREDIGRHNALDKVIGAAFGAGLDLNSCFIVVTSRAGFELVHKTVRVGVPLLAALGAPSSLAVDMARRFDVALVGFLGEQRFNLYSSWERVHGAPDVLQRVQQVAG